MESIKLFDGNFATLQDPPLRFLFIPLMTKMTKYSNRFGNLLPQTIEIQKKYYVTV